MSAARISVVDVKVVHPCQKKNFQGASATAGHAATKAECEKVTKFTRIGEDAAQYDFIPFAVETYGRLGASAQSCLKQLGEVAAAGGGIFKAHFVRSAYREVSCAPRYAWTHHEPWRLHPHCFCPAPIGLGFSHHRRSPTLSV